MVEKLMELTPKLQRLHRQYDEGFQRQTDVCRKRVIESRRSFNLSSSAEYVEAKAVLAAKYPEQEIYWKQRAKVNWLLHGDWNTRYFHNYDLTERESREDLMKSMDWQFIDHP